MTEMNAPAAVGTRGRRPGPLVVALGLAVAVGGAGLVVGLHSRAGSGAAGSGASVAPQNRAGGALAFDPASGQTILLTAPMVGSGPGDTWAWDGSGWSHLHPAHSPSARYGSHMAYDAHSSRLVLAGGFTAGPRPMYACRVGTPCTPPGSLAETWTWDGSDWMLQHPAHQPMTLSTLATDPDGGVIGVGALRVANLPPSDVNPAPCAAVQPSGTVCRAVPAPGSAGSGGSGSPVGGTRSTGWSGYVDGGSGALKTFTETTVRWDGSDWSQGPSLPPGVSATALVDDAPGLLLVGTVEVPGIASDCTGTGRGLVCSGSASVSCGAAPAPAPASGGAAFPPRGATSSTGAAVVTPPAGPAQSSGVASAPPGAPAATTPPGVPAPITPRGAVTVPPAVGAPVGVPAPAGLCSPPVHFTRGVWRHTGTGWVGGPVPWGNSVGLTTLVSDDPAGHQTLAVGPVPPAGTYGVWRVGTARWVSQATVGPAPAAGGGDLLAPDVHGLVLVEAGSALAAPTWTLRDGRWAHVAGDAPRQLGGGVTSCYSYSSGVVSGSMTGVGVPAGHGLGAPMIVTSSSTATVTFSPGGTGALTAPPPKVVTGCTVPLPAGRPGTGPGTP